MGLEFAYTFTQAAPPSSLRDLDDVVLLVAVKSEGGGVIPAGTEGTIVAVFREGEAYLVEFAEPDGALASVEPSAIRLAETPAL